VNFLKTDIRLKSVTVTCLAGTLTSQSDQPLWPQCVSYLPCSDPALDPEVMTFDWTSAKGTLPNVTVKYDLKAVFLFIVLKKILTCQIIAGILYIHGFEKALL
jgi:hypothetical protein